MSVSAVGGKGNEQAVERTAAGHDAAALARLRRRREEQDPRDERAAPAEVAITEAALEVAAAETTASDTPPADAAPAATSRSSLNRAPPAEESQGWLTEGFWPRAAGVGLIGAVALATDDDDSSSGNNTAPFITSNGAGTTAVVNAAENGTAVTKVTASDAESNTVRFSLSGDDANLFSIDAGSGTLTFKAAPDFETPQDKDGNNLYAVTVTASDGRLSDTQAITVTVTNVDEAGNEPPAISSNGGGSTASLNVVENTTSVTTVAAADVDAGSSVTYSISGGADAALFSINANTGTLTFKAAPNFESPQDAGGDNGYEIIVTASDGALSDSQTLSVKVTNADEAPTLTSNDGGSSAALKVNEGTTAVTTVTATDPDAGTTLVYSISGGVDSALFNIDASSGVLTFKAAPDFGAPQDKGGDNFYDLVVAVSDGRLVDTQTLTVNVLDVP